MTTVLNQLFFNQRVKVLIGKHFFFCEEVGVVDKKHPNRSKCWHKVCTLFFQTSLLNKFHENAGKWRDDVLGRLSSSIDLVASDAIYHEQCESNIFTKKCTPINMSGRTGNAMKSNFEKLCKWLDKQTELLTVSKLHAKMCSFAEKYLNAYFSKWMKKQLQQH